MKTIATAVEDIMSRKPLYQELMLEGIANHAQLARKIQPEVEKYLYEKVSTAAIAMALHRLSTHMRMPDFGTQYLKRMHDMTVRSNLVEFTFPNSGPIADTLDAIAAAAHRQKDSFFNFSRGIREVVVIVDATLAAKVEALLEKVQGSERSAELSAITLRLPEESLSVPGLYYQILRALAHEGISFVEVVSARTEFTIVFEDKDVDRAFSVLKRITT